MKTTIDLDDDLLTKAKAVATKRKTTLKAMITHSLQREISEGTCDNTFDRKFYEMGELGLPVLKKTGKPVTSKMVRQIMEEEDEAELNKATRMRNPQGV